MSVRKSTERGCTFQFDNTADVMTHIGLRFPLIRQNGPVWLPTSNVQHATANAAVTDDILHRRLAHLHAEAVRKTASCDIKGIPKHAGEASISFCKPCALSKATKANANRNSTRDDDPEDPLDTVSLDIWGSMQTPTHTGEQYVLGACCHTTGMVFDELLKLKSDSPDAFENFVISAKPLEHCIKTVRIDNDSVFLGREFMDICKKHSIRVERTAPYAHHQLGRMERQWRTLGEAA